MYNLVCFPHYTCGGMLCDILNDSFSVVSIYNGGIASLHHDAGKIGDTESIFEEFDQKKLFTKLEKWGKPEWIGTHCWLGNTPLESVNSIINITTSTYKSRLYRWIRAVNHYYIPSDPWLAETGNDQGYRDKAKETAKNYLKPFRPIKLDKVINLEFSDIVEMKPEFISVIQKYNYKQSINRWQEQNSFLYNQNLLRSFEAEVFHEAEHEINLKEYYVYEVDKYTN